MGAGFRKSVLYFGRMFWLWCYFQGVWWRKLEIHLLLLVGIARSYSYPEKLPDCCYNALVIRRLVLVGAYPTNKS